MSSPNGLQSSKWHVFATTSAEYTASKPFMNWLTVLFAWNCSGLSAKTSVVPHPRSLAVLPACCMASDAVKIGYYAPSSSRSPLLQMVIALAVCLSFTSKPRIQSYLTKITPEFVVSVYARSVIAFGKLAISVHFSLRVSWTKVLRSAMRRSFSYSANKKTTRFWHSF